MKIPLWCRTSENVEIRFIFFLIFTIPSDMQDEYKLIMFVTWLFNLPWPQNVPVNPGLHSHWYVPATFTHAPLLRHCMFKHSFTSETNLNMWLTILQKNEIYSLHVPIYSLFLAVTPLSHASITHKRINRVIYS